MEKQKEKKLIYFFKVARLFCNSYRLITAIKIPQKNFSIYKFGLIGCWPLAVRELESPANPQKGQTNINSNRNSNTVN